MTARNEKGALKARVLLDYSHDKHVGWITIDNTAKHNAMSLAMWEQLGAVLDQLTHTPGLRSVVLRGAGDRAFVSGADISEFVHRRRSPKDVQAYDVAADGAMDRLYNLEIPTVAMISGICFGAGMALAMCCDIRIADESSRFSVPAARLGVGYPLKEIERLLQVVNPPAALDMLFSGRRLTAAEALAAGVLNQVHPSMDLEGKVEEYVGIVATNAPLTIRASKRIVRELSGRGPADEDTCARLVAACFASADYVEGSTAFMEKRTPRFEGH